MYIESVPNRKSPPAILLREGKRVGKKVVKRTLANLTHWPENVVEGLRTLLKGGVALGRDDPRLSITRTLPHGHVAAVLGTIKNIGLDKMIDRRHTRMRNVTLGMIASRILSPSSKLAATREWGNETASMSLGDALGISDAKEPEAYAAMDWLLKRQPAIEQQLAGKHLTDGCLVLCDASETVRTYKSLSRVEQAFRSLKSVDLHVRPIYHHLDDRVRAHIFLCMLAYYVEWHMRQRLAPLLFDDEHKEEMAGKKASVVAPAICSPSAKNKAGSKRTKDGLPVSSFQTLLKLLSSLCRNTIEFKMPGSDSFYRNTEPTALQAKAFELLEVKI